MSVLDSVLSQLGGNVDIASIAAKVGIDPAVAQNAVAALSQAHAQPGDTVDAAAAQTGLDAATLQQVIGAMGGESNLGQLAQQVVGHPQFQSVLGMLDRNGDGSAIDDVLGMAKGFFGKS
ncbi:hypothetical protein GTZ99_03885 [Novosphingobium sp. FSY-8]|uniref:DUF937 domain-containing protein n=1 Tax=Novosphingobium ovatum TaxID=1908523 RepID=A0ABW9XAY8_9SPHN|nr:hypothetical protein [Novosphingobium ovatum]NBC35693.1 hypothetical protein [Novosphingobium ovatum]